MSLSGYRARFGGAYFRYVPAITDGSDRTAGPPNPLTVAARIRRDARDTDRGRATRKAECLWCARETDHVPGPVTQVADGSVAVQWWTCVECTEGRTVL
ncbi:hypothetical protein GCM10022242_20290 [Nocardioides panacisoli]|uniref:Uncharacterized protein n=1 Tax=Nocardioides panacisoli TaxID=627624 RepID=A0ABP7IHG9_9ACTN